MTRNRYRLHTRLVPSSGGYSSRCRSRSRTGRFPVYRNIYILPGVAPFALYCRFALPKRCNPMPVSGGGGAEIAILRLSAFLHGRTTIRRRHRRPLRQVSPYYESLDRICRGRASRQSPVPYLLPRSRLSARAAASLQERAEKGRGSGAGGGCGHLPAGRISPRREELAREGLNFELRCFLGRA